MSLVFVGKARERLPLGHFQPALRTFERLNAGLLVKTEHHRMLRRSEVQPHHIGSLLRKLRVGGKAPTAPSFEADAVLAQHLPNPVGADFQGLAQQNPVPPGVPRRRRLIEFGQQPRWQGLGLDQGRPPRPEIIVQPTEAFALKARAPFAHATGAEAQQSGNLVGGCALRRLQNDSRPQGVTGLSFWLAQQRPELPAFIETEDDWGGWT